MFDLIDLNYDGVIEPLEFKQFHIGMDTDEDNTVTIEEFITWL